MNEDILYQLKSLDNQIIRIIENTSNNEIPTRTQMQIIDYIFKNKNKNVYQKDLEDILNLRRATVSGVLKTMEKNKLIVRITSQDDTRTKQILITSKTKDNFLKGQENVDRLKQDLFRNISDEELNNFLVVLNKMQINLKERNV